MTDPATVPEPPNRAAGCPVPATPVQGSPRVRWASEWASCSGCDARWTGQNRAHCGSCHRTFAGAGYFDRHRRAYACVDPATIDGLDEVDGIWRGPGMTEAQRVRAFGNRNEVP